MLHRSNDTRVQRALAGDGRNLGKSRQRKWQRILLQLRIIQEIPHTNPQLYEAGPSILNMDSYIPFRKELSDGSKVIAEDGTVIDKIKETVVAKKTTLQSDNTVKRVTIQTETPQPRAVATTQSHGPPKPGSSGMVGAENTHASRMTLTT